MMLTDLTAASSAGEFSILPGSRRRSWSDSGFSSKEKRRISVVAVPGKSTKRIKVNVSGKRYELTYRRLLKFPKSLLARWSKRKAYYDEEKGEFFFDRNRMAFESVYHFYQTAGEFLRPDHIPVKLLLAEMQFFGLLEYLCTRERVKEVVPSNKYQKMIWELFEHPGANAIARLLNVVMLLLIFMSIILLFIETLPRFSDADISANFRNVQAADSNQTKVNQSLMHVQTELTRADITVERERHKLFIVEGFCVGCFTLELLIRFIVSPNKLRFFKSVLNVFDLVAVLPFYLTIAISTSPVAIQSAYVLRVLRLSRILRLVKIYRYSATIQVFARTVRECLSDFLTLGFLILTSTLVFASCGYYFEQEHQGTNFVSIPAACWWALITMTSVGYGDMAPVTLAGKITGGFCAVSGVVIIAPLLPIIGSKFSIIQENTQFEKQLASVTMVDEESNEPLEENDMELLAEQENLELFVIAGELGSREGLGRRRSATVN